MNYLFIKLMCFLGNHDFHDGHSELVDKLIPGRIDNESYQTATTYNCKHCSFVKLMFSSLIIEDKVSILPLNEYNEELNDKIYELLRQQKSVKEIVEITKVSESTVRRRVKALKIEHGEITPTESLFADEGQQLH